MGNRCLNCGKPNHAGTCVTDPETYEKLMSSLFGRNMDYKKLIKSIMAQREEILQAFIAKYGCEPDQVVQVEQKISDGTTRWFVKREESPPVMATIEDNTQEALQAIADYVSHKAGMDYGFMVLVFPFGSDPKTANYISNACREDMIKVLREKADVLEDKMDITGTSSCPS